MCYTSASAVRAGAIQTLRSGMLILSVPSFLIFGAIFILLYRYPDRFTGGDG
jgi:hypothetical protein